MLAALNPMLNETVEHWNKPKRDAFGKETYDGGTIHKARIVRSPGVLVGPASGADLTNAAAQIWILNHPRQILIGNLFQLPGDDEPLKVIRLETRTAGRVTLHKVWIS